MITSLKCSNQGSNSLKCSSPPPIYLPPTVLRDSHGGQTLRGGGRVLPVATPLYRLVGLWKRIGRPWDEKTAWCKQITWLKRVDLPWIDRTEIFKTVTPARHKDILMTSVRCLSSSCHIQMISRMRHFPRLRDIFKISVGRTRDKQCPGNKGANDISFSYFRHYDAPVICYISHEISRRYSKKNTFKNEIIKGLHPLPLALIPPSYPIPYSHTPNNYTILKHRENHKY